MRHAKAKAKLSHNQPKLPAAGMGLGGMQSEKHARLRASQLLYLPKRLVSLNIRTRRDKKKGKKNQSPH
jgi:hypothetical protein